MIGQHKLPQPRKPQTSPWAVAVERGVSETRAPNHPLSTHRKQRETHLPVVSVLGPDNGSHVEGSGDETDTVVDVTEGRAPALGGHAKELLDSLAGVVELGKGLLVRERGHVLVRPGVDTDLVAVVLGADSLDGPVDNVGANEEHGGLLVLLREEVVESVVRAVGSVVKAKTPSLGLGNGGNVGSETGRRRGRGALGVGPPAVSVGGVGGVGGSPVTRVVTVTLDGDVGEGSVQRSVDGGEKSSRLSVVGDNVGSRPDGRVAGLDGIPGGVGVVRALRRGV